jgi:hypothetical protein
VVWQWVLKEKGQEKEKPEKGMLASRLDLFYDLVFAVVIAQLGQSLSHDVSSTGSIDMLYCLCLYGGLGLEPPPMRPDLMLMIWFTVF